MNKQNEFLSGASLRGGQGVHTGMLTLGRVLHTPLLPANASNLALFAKGTLFLLIKVVHVSPFLVVMPFLHVRDPTICSTQTCRSAEGGHEEIVHDRNSFSDGSGNPRTQILRWKKEHSHVELRAKGHGPGR